MNQVEVSPFTFAQRLREAAAILSASIEAEVEEAAQANFKYYEELKKTWLHRLGLSLLRVPRYKTPEEGLKIARQQAERFIWYDVSPTQMIKLAESMELACDHGIGFRWNVSEKIVKAVTNQLEKQYAEGIRSA